MPWQNIVLGLMSLVHGPPLGCKQLTIHCWRWQMQSGHPLRPQAPRCWRFSVPAHEPWTHSELQTCGCRHTQIGSTHERVTWKSTAHVECSPATCSLWSYLQEEIMIDKTWEVGEVPAASCTIRSHARTKVLEPLAVCQMQVPGRGWWNWSGRQKMPFMGVPQGSPVTHTQLHAASTLLVGHCNNALSHGLRPYSAPVSIHRGEGHRMVCSFRQELSCASYLHLVS